MKNELLTPVFERLRGQLFSRARNVVRNDDDAQDILQDAFVRLWSSHIDINRTDQAQGLLNVTVRNLSIDHYRRSQDRQSVSIDNGFDRDNGEIDDCDRDETLQQVNAIIARHLSARDREILLRRDRDGWEFEDLAEEYGLSAANVRVIVARARRTVREIYKQTGTI